jgi:hypothetical protein
MGARSWTIGVSWFRGASVVATVGLGLMLIPVATGTAPGAAGAGRPGSGSACSLGPNGVIKHVIYMQFDNTHFTRTPQNPNVASDIEQIPALYNFMTQNGTVLTNDHTPLIAHTADDLVTSLTGVYGNQHGDPEANTYRYYNPTGTTSQAGSFSYWTDPVDSYATPTGKTASDMTPNMLTATGKMAPAPWVPFTRAGCNVGDVAMANMDLENIVPDVPDVFGPTSTDGKTALAAGAATNSTTPALIAQYEGLSVHCTTGAAFCADNAHNVPDALPTEPGGYTGYKAVFGSKYLDGELSTGSTVTNLTGTTIIGLTHAVPGFPGYDGMQPTNALAYTLDMQSHGIPVTYTYITDAHTNATTGAGMGPGETVYEQQLKAYTAAFAKFFADLAAAGINKSNTLFVFGEDENDHFAGGPPTTPNCTGVNVACTYPKLGEIDLNLRGLLATKDGIITPFRLHTDSAPFVYLTGKPARTAPVVRAFGRGLATVKAKNTYKTTAEVPVTNYLADPVELQVLHMITADPNRTPTLAMFATPDFYVVRHGASCTTGTTTCESPDTAVWNHGDVAPDINRSWMAFVGPGVQNLGVTGSLWASETDTRPTLMALLNLKDDYTHEGRVLAPIMNPRFMAPALHSRVFEQLAEAYTSIEQPVGPFGLATLAASTNGIASGTVTNDTLYQQTETRIATLGAQRDRVGSQMIGLLEGAAFSGHAIPSGEARSLIAQATTLVSQAQRLAG